MRAFLVTICVVASCTLSSTAQQKRAFEENVRERERAVQQMLTGGDQPQPGQLERSFELMWQQRRTAATEANRAVANGQKAAAEPQWISVGPNPSTLGSTAGGKYNLASGRISSIAVDPRDKNIVYAGAASGGVWKSTDGGNTWTPLTDDQPSLAAGAIAIDPAHPETVYVGTGERRGGSLVFFGAGILKSTNGGQTWTQIGQTLAPAPKWGGQSAIAALSISPDGSRILAAVQQDFESQGSGIYLSTDGGQNWSQRPVGEFFWTWHDVEFATNTIAYAATEGQGIFKSTDGGMSWNAVSSGKIPVGNARTLLTVSPQNANVVYTAMEAASGNSVLKDIYRTTDGGATWTALNAPNFCGPQCFWDMAIAVSPTDSNVVWAAGSAGLYRIMRSLDGGQTWADLHTDDVHVDGQALAFSADGTRLYFGNDGGMYSTETITASPVRWKNLNQHLQTTQHYAGLDLHPSNVAIKISGTQDNGTHYFNGIGPWIHASCGDGTAAVISQTQPTVSYTGCQMGELDKSETGQPGSWWVMPGGPSDPATFITMWAGDPTDGDTVYFAGPRLWQSRDAARTWAPITGFIHGTPDQGIVSRIAPCASDPDVVYVSGTGGAMKKITAAKSSPFGSVVPVTDVSFGATRNVNSISVHPDNCDEVAATQIQLTGARVMHTTNGGTTWNDATGDLPALWPYAVVIDPDIPDTMYLSTSLTVYVTRNGGMNWTPFGTGLPNVHGLDMKFHRLARTLVVATFGRGIWDAYAPIQYNGPALTVTPGSVTFTAQNVGAASRRSTREVRLSNPGSADLSIAGIWTDSTEFKVNPDLCPAVLHPGENCTVYVNFAPRDQGHLTAKLQIATNAVNAGMRTVFLDGAAVYLPDNDNFADAKVISGLPYRDKISTRGATGQNSDPSAFCPSVSSRRSVWYRYMPSQSGPITLSTNGSDHHTMISVFSGTTPPLTRVTCNSDFISIDIPTNTLTFNAEAGVNYYFLISSVTESGGSLIFSANWPEQLDVRPKALTFTSYVGAPAASGEFQIVNRSAAQSLPLNLFPMSPPFTSVSDCPPDLPARAACVVTVRFQPATGGTAAASLDVEAGASGVAHISITGHGVSFQAERPPRSVRNAAPSPVVDMHAIQRNVVLIADPLPSEAVELECAASSGLRCTLLGSRFAAGSDGKLVVPVLLQAESVSRPRRLRSSASGSFTLRIKGGPGIYTEPVRLRPW